MQKEGRPTGEEGREGRSRYEVDPAGCGDGEKRVRAHGGKRIGGFFDTVVGRNKRLFAEKEERSGKGERGETEGQDVTRRNATGRRLNPFEEQRGRVSENRSRLFRPTLPPPSFPTGFNRRPVALRRVTSCPSVSPFLLSRTFLPSLQITVYFVRRR